MKLIFSTFILIASGFLFAEPARAFMGHPAQVYAPSAKPMSVWHPGNALVFVGELPGIKADGVRIELQKGEGDAYEGKADINNTEVKATAKVARKNKTHTLLEVLLHFPKVSPGKYFIEIDNH